MRGSVNTLLFCFLMNSVYAQDVLFTQPTNPGNILNPAFNGVDSSMQIKVGSRLQWPKINGTYFTNFISWNSYITKTNGYAGFRCVSDNSGKGILKTKSLYFFYAQLIKINKNFIFKPAVEFGIIEKKLDWTKLNYGDQIDSRNGFVYQTQNQTIKSKTRYFDINIGGLFQYKKLTLGLNAHHITQPNESVINGSSPLPMRYGVQLGYRFTISSCTIQPYFFYQKQQNFYQLMIGSQFRFFDVVNLLFAWRQKDAAIFGLGYAGRKFSVIYSYDYFISKLTNQTGGSHELTFGMRFLKFKTHKKFAQTYSVFAN